MPFFRIHPKQKRNKKFKVQCITEHLLSELKLFKPCYAIALLLSPTPPKKQNWTVQEVPGPKFTLHYKSLRWMVTEKLLDAKKYDLLKDLSGDVDVPLVLYADGSTVLHWPVYMGTVAFEASSYLFKDITNTRDMLEHSLWMFGFLPENKEIVKQCEAIKGKQIYQLQYRPIVIDDVSYHCKVTIISCDHKMGWVNLGNKCGGHHRCPYCNVDFSNLMSPQLWDLLVLENNKKTFWKGYQQFCEDKEKLAGLECMPPMLEFLKENEEFLESWLPFLDLGIDNLHNVKGMLKAIVKVEQLTSSFQLSAFENNLNTNFRKISDMDGSYWRLFALCYKDLIFPFVDTKRQKKFSDMMDNYVEIQWILYTPPQVFVYLFFFFYFIVFFFFLLFFIII